MAAQPGSAASALPAAAHVVGNAFVNQYYNVLHQSPQVVHRFYTDASRLTRAEAGSDGAVETVVSQSEIHQKVMALDYGDFKAEIVTVDSQDSLTGGVLVMVTGSLSSALKGRRNFVQSFFLAPQEKGYFVLNDVFRYLNEEPKLSNSIPMLANGVSEPPQVDLVSEPERSVATDLQVRKIPAFPGADVEHEADGIFNSSEHSDFSKPEEAVAIDNLIHPEMARVIEELPTSVAGPCLSAEEEAPKKSYASILLMKENSASSSTLTGCSTVPKASANTAERLPPFSDRATVAIAGEDNVEDESPIETEVDGQSVYVKNLPMSMTSGHLEEEFGKFGVVKHGGVIVKSQKQGVCYAFVEFEEATSAQAAIESSPRIIGGRQVFIEEKRPMGPRFGGRGFRAFGTGRVERLFRSDGIRGRMATSGRGAGGRPHLQDIPSKGRGSGNLGGVSGNDTKSSILVGPSSRDAAVGSGNRGPRRGVNQAPRTGAVSKGVPPATAM